MVVTSVLTMNRSSYDVLIDDKPFVYTFDSERLLLVEIVSVYRSLMSRSKTYL